MDISKGGSLDEKDLTKLILEALEFEKSKNNNFMQNLHFEISINAPKNKVWDTMLTKKTYEMWTSVFQEGSTFEGTWEKGSEIKFSDGTNSGLLGKIIENKLHQFISIKYLGEIKDGKLDTEGKYAKFWNESFENYAFSENEGNTKLEIDLTLPEDMIELMGGSWPKALEKLKEITE